MQPLEGSVQQHETLRKKYSQCGLYSTTKRKIYFLLIWQTAAMIEIEIENPYLIAVHNAYFFKKTLGRQSQARPRLPPGRQKLTLGARMVWPLLRVFSCLACARVARACGAFPQEEGTLAEANWGVPCPPQHAQGQDCDNGLEHFTSGAAENGGCAHTR